MSVNSKYRGKKERAAPMEKPMVVKILSEHKKRIGRRVYASDDSGRVVGSLGPREGVAFSPAPSGMRRVMALVRIPGQIGEVTRHVNVPKV